MSNLPTIDIVNFRGLKLFISSIMIFLVGIMSVTKASETKWITAQNFNNSPGTWIIFRKSILINDLPDTVNTRIAVDSKYWLYINNKLVVFEGGIKRGPNPIDTYADIINIRSYLKKGNNTITILMYFFGKDGFSHKNSGKAGLFWESKCGSFVLKSDSSWKAQVFDAYSADSETPNFRLPESNIIFDARKDLTNWHSNNFPDNNMPFAIEIGIEGSEPWNKLINRPIPLFSFSGLKTYKSVTIKNDTIICELPYNAQITPYLRVKSNSGKRIEIKSDNHIYYNAGGQNIKSTYITKNGIQAYESLGWMNGHKIYYILPKGVKLIDVKYRESGYNTSFDGDFKCSDTFFNQLWKKAQRTLYLCMRDSYMDCPDRERAQWSGDAVILSGEVPYALSPTALQISRKWLSEIIDWQKPNGVLYSPVPSGNWDKELPEQMLATIGYYGLWNYYMQTGDVETLKKAYPKAKQYLSLWLLETNGTLKIRQTDWMWGDWGFNIDKTLLYNSWYYLALKGMMLVANEIGLQADKEEYNLQMLKFKTAFNDNFWNGNYYQSPSFTENADDRGQALAVLAGLADPTKYSKLIHVFRNNKNASPYMEKYVFEAMIKMGFATDALNRQKERFSAMVNDKRFSTLFEGWEIGSEIYGGGTVNHAWSGGGLIILSQYICGISAEEPAFKVISFSPSPGNLSMAKTRFNTVQGKVSFKCKKTPGMLKMGATIPSASTAVIKIENKYIKKIKLNGKTIENYCSKSNNSNLDFSQTVVEDSVLNIYVNSKKFNLNVLYQK